MRIKRAVKSFRTGLAIAGPKGCNEGDLLPENHPLVKKLPELFEDVDAYVARQYPELYTPDKQKITRQAKPDAPESGTEQANPLGLKRKADNA